MDTRDKLKKAKTLGKTTVSKDGKTKTTTNKGWSITSGVQKKTVAPKHKASPASTVGRSIKYHGGKSNVVDLGHNPTKSAISTATTKLRKAKTATKPKATKHSTASVPTVKVPQVGAPTVPSHTPDTKPGASSNTAGKVVAAGVAVAGATGIAAVALKKAKAPVPKAKPPRPSGDPKQLKLPGAPKVTAPKTPTVAQRHTARRAKQGAELKNAFGAAARADARATSLTPKDASLGERHAARRAKQGAELKNAFGAAARADARAAAPSKATVKAGGKTLEAASIVEQRPKQIVSSKMDAEGKRTTKVLRGDAMDKVQDAADKRVGEERRQASRRDQATRPKKPNKLAAPKQSSRRKAGQRRAPGVAAVTPPKAPSAAGFGASEADIKKVATSGEKVKAPTTAQAAANKAKVAEAPKEVRDMVADIDKAAKVEAPKVGRFPTHPTMGGLAADQKGKVRAPLKGVAPPSATPDPKLVKALEKARGENVKLKAAQPADQALVDAELKAAKARAPAKPAKVEAPAEPMRGVTEGETRAAAGDLRGVNVGSVEPTRAQGSKKTATDKDFYRKRGAARRAANKQAIEAKGLATIPTDPTEVTSEEALVKQKVAERNLMDAVARAEGAGPKPAPKAVGAEGDKRKASDIFSVEEVKAKTRVIDMVPPDLETEHGGGRQRGTIGDLIGKDQDARAARGEEIRRAASKARNIAASRNASPAQMENLERAVDAEYDKGLEKYFDEAEPRNQRGPRKPDVRPRLLDPIIDAEVELANERGSAMPPAPSDRTTLDQKIAMVEERAKAGGEAIYQPKKTLETLRNIREHGRATPTPLRRTTAMPPQADLVTEQFAKDRPSVLRAKQAGVVAGETAAKAKRVSGEPGPVKVPDMTKPGVIPAGPKTPPVEPARERGVVKGAQPKTMSQLWAGRMADWGRSMYQAQVKRLTSPAIDVAGEKAKATFSSDARVKAAKGLGVASLAFTGLGAGEAYAAEHDPKKRLGAAGKQFKEELPDVTKNVALFTGADLLATKAAPAAVGAVTKSAFARGATAALGKIGLGAVIGYHSIPYAIREAKKLASSIGEAQFDKGEAAREKKASEAKYGTVALATKTRHAKEAYKKRLALEAKKRKK